MSAITVLRFMSLRPPFISASAATTTGAHGITGMVITHGASIIRAAMTIIAAPNDIVIAHANTYQIFPSQAAL
jgi:hypothetical protein